MPPRKNASKTTSQSASDDRADRNGETTGGRSFRVRKPVDYNEDRSSNFGKSEKPVSKKTKGVKSKNQEKRSGKNGKNEIADDGDSSSPENEGSASSSPRDENSQESATTIKESLQEKAVSKKTKAASLNETFVFKDMQKTNAKGKGNKRNPKTVAENEPEAKKNKDANEKLNQTNTDYTKIIFSCNKTTASGEDWDLKITSWNVDGLRAWLKKDGAKLLEHEDPDILCLQETKCSENKLPPEAKFKGYHSYWASAEKEGYSGVALFTKVEPIKVTYGIGVEEHDTEGRLITAEFEKFYLVNTYVPNAGKNLVTLPKRLSWDSEFKKYMQQLDSEKPVILCGDMNVSHQEIDLANPKTNTKNAGFTKEERDGMTELLSKGFVDTFRHFYPEETAAYTFWTYMRGARGRNIGWRLDYFIVSERIISNICDSIIRKEVFGSDHCPITLLVCNK